MATLSSESMGDESAPEALPALYHACMANDVALVERLLAQGADPNDGESVYHAAQFNRRDCLERLLAHGADLSSRNTTYGNTPLYFLAGHHAKDGGAATALLGMRWLLEHGADPNVTSEDPRETPLQCLARNGWGEEAAASFLAHGADPDLRRADGRTAYVLAIRTGNAAMAGYLLGQGADPGGVTPIDELLGACMRADEPGARALIAAHPGLMEGLTTEDRGATVSAVYGRREASVRLMAALGFDLGWEGSWGGAPLHHAAWLGDASLVRVLLTLGAPVNQRDGRFGSSPIAWAAHGSTNCGNAGADHPAVAGLLVDAGSARAASYNRWNESPESMASPAVLALLRARGFAP